MKSVKRYFEKISIKRVTNAVFFSLLLLVIPQVNADNTGIGYHAAPFLKISPAARQVAMGGAFTALTDDINLMRYNVGALGGLEYTSLALNFNNWIDDTQQGNIAFGLPLGRFGVVGVDLSFFNEGTIVELDPNFLPTGNEPSSSDLFMSVGYGKNLKLGASKNWQLGLGVAAKYLSQNLVGEISNVAALDAGMHMVFPPDTTGKLPELSLGAAMQNFGLSKVKFDSWESPLPQIYRFGAAINFRQFPFEKWRLILSSDALWTPKEKIKYQLGTELLVNRVFALRGGYKFNDASISKWGLGFGLYAPTNWLGRSKMRLDYAFSPLTAFDSDAAHRFSLHFAFGAGEEYGPDDQTLNETIALWDDMKIKAKSDSLDAALKDIDAARKRLEELEREMRERYARLEDLVRKSGGELEVARDKEDSLKILMTMRINFDFDKADIRPDAYPTMKKVGEALRIYPEAKVHIAGHTDWVGTDHYNIHLSHRRIDSVMAFLVSKENIQGNRFYMPVGYGERKALESNETDAGRARNRRVEFLLFTYDSQPEMPEGTAIKDIKLIDNNTIHIVCNGFIKNPSSVIKSMNLNDPERFVIDLEKIYLISKQKEFQLNAGPVIRARAAEHIDEEFTRIVLDVTRPISPTITTKDNFIVIKY